MFPLLGMQIKMNPNHKSNQQLLLSSIHLSNKHLSSTYSIPVMVPALMALYFCGTGRQVKQCTVYDKYYISYDWNIHHRL